MLADFFSELTNCVGELGIDEVHYSHVDKHIDENKTYITYYRVTKNPDYEIGTCSSVMQVSVFSKNIEKALTARNHISMHFFDMNKIVGDTEICGTNIESELEEYNFEDYLHQAITTIRLLTKSIT